MFQNGEFETLERPTFDTIGVMELDPKGAGDDAHDVDDPAVADGEIDERDERWGALGLSADGRRRKGEEGDEEFADDEVEEEDEFDDDNELEEDFDDDFDDDEEEDDDFDNELPEEEEEL